ncbi:hypothetical protein H5V45_09865 [Nocardioides sp. KIGAM211]|uniref:Lipopolysaccharide assembly protein A domain-containing protein n=1 Tax=Nocardioides luti TaxID=2761101 RepID=A0A7X0VB62_9ACTN|nr:hypothetical protein [Nocardioides luti]MBB6627627.1 hypothetical protein [Nocardioides luti]
MLILGLLLIAAGVVAILAAVATASGTVELLGTDLNALTIFLVGVGAGVAILWGFSISKYGTKRSLQHRRESKRLNELSQKLDRVEAERRDDPATDLDRPREDRPGH